MTARRQAVWLLAPGLLTLLLLFYVPQALMVVVSLGSRSPFPCS